MITEVGKCLSQAVKEIMLDNYIHEIYIMHDWLIFGVKRHFQQYFSYIMATSFSVVMVIWKLILQLPMQLPPMLWVWLSTSESGVKHHQTNKQT
jgi:hypothetical protein